MKKISTDTFAIITATDESAFLNVDSSNKNPSLLTKIFLEKEVFTNDGKLENSEKYIDYMFKKGATRESDSTEIFQNLLGNQSKRQFLFDPTKLQEFINNKYSMTDQKLVNFLTFLVPGSSGSSQIMYSDFNRGGMMPKMEAMRISLSWEI